MTHNRLLWAILLICSAMAPAQKQKDSTSAGIKPDQARRSVEVARALPRAMSTRPQDVSAQGKQPNRWQIEQFNVNRDGYPVKFDDPIALNLDGQFGHDNVCYAIRSYVVARDTKDSDSVHPVGYTTCVPARPDQLKKAQQQK
jgi:hypothetical protein